MSSHRGVEMKAMSTTSVGESTFTYRSALTPVTGKKHGFTTEELTLSCDASERPFESFNTASVSHGQLDHSISCLTTR